MTKPVSHTPKSLQKLYHQARWNRTKQKVIAREHGRCERCHKLITGRFIVHHKKLATEDNFFDLDNLRLLCQECHNFVTFHEGINRRSQQDPPMISKNSDLIPYDTKEAENKKL